MFDIVAEHVTGDIVDFANSGEYDVVIHGCNCFNTMGSGVALALAREYPAIERVDNETIRGDKNKLGGYTSAYALTPQDQPLLLINLYQQWRYGPRSQRNFSLDAFKTALSSAKEIIPPGSKILMPHGIGSGSAGGYVKAIHRAIQNILEGYDVTFVKFP